MANSVDYFVMHPEIQDIINKPCKSLKHKNDHSISNITQTIDNTNTKSMRKKLEKDNSGLVEKIKITNLRRGWNFNGEIYS